MEIQTFFGSHSSLTWQDYSVVLVLLVLLIFVGIYFGREEKTPTTFSWGENNPVVGGLSVVRGD